MLLDEEEPDVLTIYDDNGVYGHPDHIQVHRVGKRAGELSAVPVVAQGTMNRDWMRRGFRESGREGDIPPNMGKPESEITHRVEAVDFVEQKRASMRAHASQMAPDHFLLALPDPMFALGMGTEFYIVGPAAEPRRDPRPVRGAVHPAALTAAGNGARGAPSTPSRATIPGDPPSTDRESTVTAVAPKPITSRPYPARRGGQGIRAPQDAAGPRIRRTSRSCTWSPRSGSSWWAG